jgi:hypothetical protein
VLHERGYHRVRARPGLGGTGMWRVEVTTAGEVNTLFNAPTTNKAILALTNELRYNPALRAGNDIRSSDRGPCRALAKRVVAAIHHKHRRIKSYFGSACGARFQPQDSEMAIEVMTRMIGRSGRCPLPIHDSFLVPEIDADLLSQTMIEVAKEHSLELDLKDSRGRLADPSNMEMDHPQSVGPILASQRLLPTSGRGRGEGRLPPSWKEGGGVTSYFLHQGHRT